jgi:hypothetical protein
MNTNCKLDRFFNRGFVFTEGVRDQFLAIWELADMALIKSSEAMGHLLEDPASLVRANAEFYEGAPLGDRLEIWGSVTRYHINSLLTVFSRDLDEGLTILRMATELARTLKTITSSAHLHTIGANGEDKSSKVYRKAAKFNENNSIEASVFAAYKFCSNHGPHGHTTSAVYLEDGLMGR